MMLNSSVERGHYCLFINLMVRATSLSLIRGPNNTHIKMFDTISWLLDIIFFHFNSFFSSLCFSLDNVYWSIFKDTDSFFGCVKFTWRPWKEFSKICCYVFIKTVSIRVLSIVSFCAEIIHLIFMLFIFSIRDFNMAIMVILISLTFLHLFYIQIGSVNCLFSWQFFYFFHNLIFCCCCC